MLRHNNLADKITTDDPPLLSRYYLALEQFVFDILLNIGKSSYTPSLVFVILQWLVITLQLCHFIGGTYLPYQWDARVSYVFMTICEFVSTFPGVEDSLKAYNAAIAVVCVPWGISLLAIMIHKIVAWKWPFILAYHVLTFASTTLFIPTAAVFTRLFFGCLHYSHGDTHPFFPSLACWDDQMAGYATGAWILLGFYLISTIVVHLTLFPTDLPRDLNGGDNFLARSLNRVETTGILAKVALLLLFSSGRTDSWRGPMGFLLLLCGGVIATMHIRALEPYSDTLAAMYVGQWLLLVWAGVVAVLMSFLKDAQGTGMLFFIGIPLVIMGAVCAVRWRYTAAASMEHRELTSGLDYVMMARALIRRYIHANSSCFHWTDASPSISEAYSKLLNAVDTILEQGITRFPECMRLRCFRVSYFLIIRENRAMAMRELASLNATEAFLDIRYAAFAAHEAVSHCVDKQRSAEVERYMEFRDTKALADQYTSETAKMLVMFWTELLGSNPSIDTLATTGFLAREKLMYAISQYERLLEINEDSISVLRTMGLVYLHITGELQKAADMISKADALENKVSSALVEQREKGFMVHHTVKLDIFDDRNAVIGISLTEEAFGIMESVNISAHRIFGFSSQQDMLGRNISAICPDPVGMHHDQLMRNFLLRKTSRVVNHTRTVFGHHVATGFLIPVDLYVRWGAGNALVGVLRPLVIAPTHAYITVDPIRKVVISASRTYLQLFGQSRSELMTHSLKISAVIPALNEEESEDVQGAWTRILRKEGYETLGMHSVTGRKLQVHMWGVILDVVGIPLLLAKLDCRQIQEEEEDVEEEVSEDDADVLFSQKFASVLSACVEDDDDNFNKSANNSNNPLSSSRTPRLSELSARPGSSFSLFPPSSSLSTASLTPTALHLPTAPPPTSLFTSGQASASSSGSSFASSPSLSAPCISATATPTPSSALLFTSDAPQPPASSSLYLAQRLSTIKKPGAGTLTAPPRHHPQDSYENPPDEPLPLSARRAINTLSPPLSSTLATSSTFPASTSPRLPPGDVPLVSFPPSSSLLRTELSPLRPEGGDVDGDATSGMGTGTCTGTGTGMGTGTGVYGGTGTYPAPMSATGYHGIGISDGRASVAGLASSRDADEAAAAARRRRNRFAHLRLRRAIRNDNRITEHKLKLMSVVSVLMVLAMMLAALIFYFIYEVEIGYLTDTYDILYYSATRSTYVSELLTTLTSHWYQLMHPGDLALQYHPHVHDAFTADAVQSFTELHYRDMMARFSSTSAKIESYHLGFETAAIKALRTGSTSPLEFLTAGQVGLSYMSLKEASRSFSAMSQRILWLFKTEGVTSTMRDISFWWVVANGPQRLRSIAGKLTDLLLSAFDDYAGKIVLQPLYVLIVSLCVMLLSSWFIVRPIVVRVEEGKTIVLDVFLDIPRSIRRALRRKALLVYKDLKRRHETDMAAQEDVDDAEREQALHDQADLDSLSDDGAALGNDIRKESDDPRLSKLAGFSERRGFANSPYRDAAYRDAGYRGGDAGGLVGAGMGGAGAGGAGGYRRDGGESDVSEADRCKVVDLRALNLSVRREAMHTDENTPQKPKIDVEKKVKSSLFSRHVVRVFTAKYTVFIMCVVAYFGILIVLSDSYLHAELSLAHLFVISARRLPMLQMSWHMARLNVLTNYTHLVTQDPNNAFIRAGSYVDLGTDLFHTANRANLDATFGIYDLTRRNIPELTQLLFRNPCGIGPERYAQIGLVVRDYFFKHCHVVADGTLRTGVYSLWLDITGQLEPLLDPEYSNFRAYLDNPASIPSHGSYDAVVRVMEAMNSLNEWINFFLGPLLKLAVGIIHEDALQMIHTFNVVRLVMLIVYMCALLLLYSIVLYPTARALSLDAQKTKSLMLLLPPDLVRHVVRIQDYITVHMAEE